MKGSSGPLDSMLRLVKCMALLFLARMLSLGYLRTGDMCTCHGCVIDSNGGTGVGLHPEQNCKEASLSMDAVSL